MKTLLIAILLLSGCAAYGPNDNNPNKSVYYPNEQAPGYDLMGNRMFGEYGMCMRYDIYA